MIEDELIERQRSRLMFRGAVAPPFPGRYSAPTPSAFGVGFDFVVTCRSENNDLIRCAYRCELRHVAWLLPHFHKCGLPVSHVT